MKKIGTIALIIFFVALAYLFLTAMQPVINNSVETANATIDASSNSTRYTETQAVLVGFPLWTWFVPATVGTAAVVITLKKDKK